MELNKRDELREIFGLYKSRNCFCYGKTVRLSDYYLYARKKDALHIRYRDQWAILDGKWWHASNGIVSSEAYFDLFVTDAKIAILRSPSKEEVESKIANLERESWLPGKFCFPFQPIEPKYKEERCPYCDTVYVLKESDEMFWKQ